MDLRRQDRGFRASYSRHNTRRTKLFLGGRDAILYSRIRGQAQQRFVRSPTASSVARSLQPIAIRVGEYELSALGLLVMKCGDLQVEMDCHTPFVTFQFVDAYNDTCHRVVNWFAGLEIARYVDIRPGVVMTRRGGDIQPLL